MTAGAASRRWLLWSVLVLWGAAVVGAEQAPAAFDSATAQRWNLSAIHVDEAQQTTRGAGAVVAVLDTGVDLRHPGLAGRVVAGPDVVDGDSSPDDQHGHGTHVAGIIVGRTSDGFGALGIAPAARVLAVRVLDARGRGALAQAARGVDAALAAGAHVINLSTSADPAAAQTGDDSAELTQAVERAARAGAVVVAAAGNHNLPWCAQPRVTVKILCVGAIDRDRRRAPYSNHSSGVNIMAPGGLPTDGSAIVSTRLGGGYRQMAGTSQAAPHVAAVAALLVSRGLLGSQIIDRIESTAIDLGEPGTDSVYGRGLVDAAAALQGARAAVPAATAFARAPRSVRMTTLLRSGLPVSCRASRGGPCTARMLTATGRLLARGTRELRAGATGTVRARLTPPGRRLLRRAAPTTSMLRVNVRGAPVVDQRVAFVR